MHRKFRRRLERLRKLLRDDARNKQGIRFNMRTWGAHARKRENPWLGEPSHEFQNGEEVTANCGTQGCALGLAAISGVFRRQGLTFYVHLNGLEVRCNDAGGCAAGQQFFGLSYNQAQWLFMPGSYKVLTGVRAEREVAHRITHILAGRKLPKPYCFE